MFRIYFGFLADMFSSWVFRTKYFVNVIITYIIEILSIIYIPTFGYLTMAY